MIKYVLTIGAIFLIGCDPLMEKEHAAREATSHKICYDRIYDSFTSYSYSYCLEYIGKFK